MGLSSFLGNRKGARTPQKKGHVGNEDSLTVSDCLPSVPQLTFKKVKGSGTKTGRSWDGLPVSRQPGGWVRRQATAVQAQVQTWESRICRAGGGAWGWSLGGGALLNKLEALVQTYHQERYQESESAFHPAASPEVADGGRILSALRNHYIILPADSLGTNDLPMTYTQARTGPFSAGAA